MIHCFQTDAVSKFTSEKKLTNESQFQVKIESETSEFICPGNFIQGYTT